MLEANARINLCNGWSVHVPIGANNDEKDASPMVDILNLALPYFGLIFIGFACGKARGCRKQAWRG